MGNYIIHDGELYNMQELYHYGVPGMKWGVRRYQLKDGTLTPEGRVRYGSAKTTSDRDHSKSNKNPALLYVANILADIGHLNPVGLGQDIARGIKAIKSNINKSKYDKDREGCETDKSTGFFKKKREMTVEEDVARVNPLVHNFDLNTKNNCMLCTATYDLRRRGYEVTAKKASEGYITTDIGYWYKNAKINLIVGRNEKGKRSTKAMISELKNDLVKQGDGARGNLMVTWSNMKGGHSVAYEIQDGQLRILDAQINKIYKNPDSLLKRCTNTVTYVRLDNLKINTKNIKEVAE